MKKYFFNIKYLIRLVLDDILMTISWLKVKSNNFKGQNLEIGSGPLRKPGWLTVDKCLGADIYWDLNKKLPFRNDEFETIYSSHVLEHFSFKELQRLLAELYRILKPGGIMSVCVPDAQIYIDIYNNKKDSRKLNLTQYQPAFISEESMDALNYLFYMNGQHKHMFDRDSLIYHLSSAGFIHCIPREFDDKLDLIERHHTSLYVECRKPSDSVVAESSN